MAIKRKNIAGKKTSTNQAKAEKAVKLVKPKALKKVKKVVEDKGVNKAPQAKATKLSAKAKEKLTNYLATQGALVSTMFAAVEEHGTDRVLAALANIKPGKPAKEPKADKAPKAPKDNKSKVVQFTRPGREFPVSLKKQKQDFATIKDGYRTALAKVPKELGVRMTHFNKVITANKTTLLVSGVRRVDGVWSFTGITADNKKANVPVESVL